MSKLDLDAHRAGWAAAADGDRGLYLDRPVVLSPAGAAQDAANRSRMMWSWAPIWLPWEYTGWMGEGRSFHDSAYIGDWSGLVKVFFKGPDALAFFSHIGTNDLSGLAVGRVMHHVQTDEQGRIAAQGVLYRVAEDELWFTGGSAYWAYHMLGHGEWDAEATIRSADQFLFSVQGPQSLPIMEAVTGARLGHLRFNDWAEYEIAGANVKLLRTGITAEVGYELHGPSESGNDVWATVVEVGEQFGIKQLGVRAQLVSHVEAAIATNDRDFVSAAASTPGKPQIAPTARSRMTGSYVPDRIEDLYRTPAEVNWFRQVSLDTHEFVGRDALIAQEQAGGPARHLTGLIWNSKDVVDVYATLFDDEPVIPMELPRYLGLAVDQIRVDDRLVGVSTSRVYSPYRHEMISLAHIDRDLVAPGTEVTVIWGEADGPQREVRATTTAIPFKRDIRRDEMVD